MQDHGAVPHDAVQYNYNALPMTRCKKGQIVKKLHIRFILWSKELIPCIFT
jgi:hypothetical protein